MSFRIFWGPPRAWTLLMRVLKTEILKFWKKRGYHPKAKFLPSSVRYTWDFQILVLRAVYARTINCMLRNHFIVILWLFQFFQKIKKLKKWKFEKKQILAVNQAKTSNFRKFKYFHNMTFLHVYGNMGVCLMSSHTFLCL